MVGFKCGRAGRTASSSIPFFLILLLYRGTKVRTCVRVPSTRSARRRDGNSGIFDCGGGGRFGRLLRFCARSPGCGDRREDARGNRARGPRRHRLPYRRITRIRSTSAAPDVFCDDGSGRIKKDRSVNAAVFRFSVVDLSPWRDVRGGRVRRSSRGRRGVRRPMRVRGCRRRGGCGRARDRGGR
jgi:hypothetical protein